MKNLEDFEPGSIVLKQLENNLPEIENDPTLKGLIATPKYTFGDTSRFAVYAEYTDGDRVIWKIDDACPKDGKCFSAVTIFSSTNREEIMKKIEELKEIDIIEFFSENFSDEDDERDNKNFWAY